MFYCNIIFLLCINGIHDVLGFFCQVKSVIVRGKIRNETLINTLLKNIYIVYAYEVRMKWFPLAQYFDKHYQR